MIGVFSGKLGGRDVLHQAELKELHAKTPCPNWTWVTRLTVCRCRGLRRMVRCLSSCIGDGS
jgi:hypothetical protein